MNQATFSTRPNADPSLGIRTVVGLFRRATRSVSRHAGEVAVLALLAIVVVAIKLVAIAVASPAVAVALASGRLFF